MDFTKNDLRTRLIDYFLIVILAQQFIVLINNLRIKRKNNFRFRTRKIH